MGVLMLKTMEFRISDTNLITAERANNMSSDDEAMRIWLNA